MHGQQNIKFYDISSFYYFFFNFGLSKIKWCKFGASADKNLNEI
jgi:hypothetical protein